MTDYADRATVRQILQDMKPEHVRCRGSRRHDPLPENLIWNAAYGFYTATEVCSRCGLRVITEMTSTWRVLARWPEYPEGYLLHGVGRIAGDAFDELRGAYYQQVFTEKRLTKHEAVQAPPRRTATKEALGLDSEPPTAPELRLVQPRNPRRSRKAG